MSEPIEQTPDPASESLAPVVLPSPEPAKPVAAIVIDDNTDLLGIHDAPITSDGMTPPNTKPEVSPVIEDEKPETGEVRSEKGWTCPKCPDKHYEYRSFLARHIKRVHKDDAEAILASLPQSQSPPGRKPGSKNTQRANFDDLAKVVQDTAPVDYKFMAEMLFNMSTGTLSGLLGPEWMPREDAPGSNSSREKDNMVECIRIYLQTRQVKDIPPGLMLTFVCVAYAGPRLKAPGTSEKVKGAWYWLRSKFSRKPKLKVL